jgi:hypothetical protein
MAIQMRRASSAAWASANPTLASGEWGYDTTLKLVKMGDAVTAWNDLAFYPSGKESRWVPVSDMVPATTNGPATATLEATTNKQNYKVLDFDGATQENAHFQIKFPKRWDKGTVTFMAVWSSTATDTDGVTWGLQATAFSDNDAVDAAWGTAQTVDDACQGAAGEIYGTAESSAITIAGTPTEGDVVFFRVFRDVADVNDNAVEDARLIGVHVFYTSNTPVDL